MKKIIVFILTTITIFSQTKEELTSLVSEGKIYEASKIAQAVSDANPSDLDLQLMAGDVFYDLEDYDKALAVYKKAEEIDDDDPKVLIRVGRTLHITGNKEEGFEYLEEARDEDDEFIPVYLEYANAYIRDKDYAEAKIWIDRGIDEDDEDTRLYLTSGNMYYDQKVYQLAEKEYLQALELDSNNTDARFKLATCYYWLATRELDKDLSNELFKKALINWEMVTKQDPFNSKAFFQSGKILFFANRFAEAAPRLNRYAELRPDDAIGRWLLAQALSKLSKCEDAKTHLEWSAANIDSVKIKAKLMLAECYVLTKESQKAVQTFQEIKNDTVLGLKELKMLGSAAISIGDTAQAIQAWDESIAMKPDANCGVMMALGQLYYVKKDYDKALNYFDKKLEVHNCDDEGSNSKAMKFAALAHLQKANIDGISDELKISNLNEAKNLIEDALKSYGQNADLTLTLGDVYVGLGDQEQTMSTYNKALELAQSDTTNANNKRVIAGGYQKLVGIFYKQKSWSKVVEYGKKWSNYSKSFGPALYVAIGYQNLYIQSGSENESLLESACKWYKKVLEINPNQSTAKKFVDGGYCD